MGTKWEWEKMSVIEISKIPQSAALITPWKAFIWSLSAYRRSSCCLMALFTNIPGLMRHRVITLQKENGHETGCLRMLKLWKQNLCFHNFHNFALLFFEMTFHSSDQRNILRAVRMSLSDAVVVTVSGRLGLQWWWQLSLSFSEERSHGCPDCGYAASQNFSVCSQPAYQSANQSVTGCLMANCPHGKGCTFRVYHMSPTNRRFTTEDDRRGEMRVRLEWGKKRDGKERKIKGCNWGIKRTDDWGLRWVAVVEGWRRERQTRWDI